MNNDQIEQEILTLTYTRNPEQQGDKMKLTVCTMVLKDGTTAKGECYSFAPYVNGVDLECKLAREDAIARLREVRARNAECQSVRDAA